MRGYPARQLPEGARVTRMAPSPTGFMHLGNLYGALVDERLAHQSGGIFILRIEDTDKKREVENASRPFWTRSRRLGCRLTRRFGGRGNRRLRPVPPEQAARKSYQAFVKKLVLEGQAYPCFCTETSLRPCARSRSGIRKNFGYYGKYAVWRDPSARGHPAELDKGTPYVVRFRSQAASKTKCVTRTL